jgi:Flp pilus assembly protein TadD
LAERGEIDNAIEHYERALAIKPDYAQAQNNLGLVLMERGRMDDATAHFQKALEIKPDMAEAHCNLGIALAGRGRIDEAIEHYRQALILATRQNNASLAEEVKVRLGPYAARIPHRQPQRPSAP